MLILWTLLQLLSVAGVASYWWYLPRHRTQVAPDGVAAIVAVRTPWPEAEAFVAKLAAPGVRAIVAVAQDDDRLATRLAGGATVIEAGFAHDEGQKIHKLRAALVALSPADRWIAFLDADAPPMLGRLLFPAVTGKAAIGSGYRLSLPPPRAPLAALVAAADLQVATLPRPPSHMMLWGGATAMARETADALDLAALWRGALSDDSVLTDAAAQAGVSMRAVRDLLVPSPIPRGEALAFGIRQYRHLRWSLPHYWRRATLILLVQAAAWFWAIAAGGWPAIAIGYAAAWLRVALRHAIARSILTPADMPALRRALAWDAAAPFAVLWFHLALAIAGAASRWIVWGNWRYRMDGARVAEMHPI